MAEEGSQKLSAIFSPEGVLMLSIFGILDIIDFFIGSFFIIDIVATLLYFFWTFIRSQTRVMEATGEGAGEAAVDWRSSRGKGKTSPSEPPPSPAKKGETGPSKKPSSPAKKGKWLRWGFFALEWIPIVGMIPGWTFMVYSELTS